MSTDARLVGNGVPLFVTRVIVTVLACNVHLSTVGWSQCVPSWGESLLTKGSQQLSGLSHLIEVDVRIVQHHLVDIDHVRHL